MVATLRLEHRLELPPPLSLGCSSHNAMWERNRHILFDATVQWLRDGRLNGASNGIVRLGY